MFKKSGGSRHRLLNFALMTVFALFGELAAGDSDAWKQSSNNNRIIEIQKNPGTLVENQQVTISFYGHAAFRITSPTGISLLFDPWRNDPSGAWGLWFPEEFPQTNVDAVLSTHAHFDHDAVYRPDSPMVMDRMAGNWRLGDISILGLADKHVCIAPGWHKWDEAFAEFGVEGCPPNNPGHMDNTIFVIETGGMRIGLWGDNRPDPAPHVEKQLAGLDVLIVPVDSSEHLLSYEQTDNIIDRLNPKVVIPAHYLTSGASSVLSTLGTAEEWVDQQTNHEKLSGADWTFSAASIASFDKYVIYFGKHHSAE